MSRKITIIMTKDGKRVIDFHGFKGNECFDKADEIYKRLRELGIDVDIKEISPKTDTPIPVTFPESAKERE